MGESHFRRALTEFIDHYAIHRRPRLGGLLNYYASRVATGKASLHRTVAVRHDDDFIGFVRAGSLKHPNEPHECVWIDVEVERREARIALAQPISRSFRDGWSW